MLLLSYKICICSLSGISYKVFKDSAKSYFLWVKEAYKNIPKP